MDAPGGEDGSAGFTERALTRPAPRVDARVATRKGASRGVAVTTGGATETGERRAGVAWRLNARPPPSWARRCTRGGLVLASLSAAACTDGGNVETPDPGAQVTLAQGVAAAPAAGVLAGDPLCTQLNPGVARAHLAAAGALRAALALQETRARWESALARLEVAQHACLLVTGVGAAPAAPARALQAALGRDASVPRAELGGVPSLAWRLLEDASVRALLPFPEIDAALEQGRLPDAYAGLLAAQRARLVALPEVLRFLDESDRARFLADPVWIAWLGLPP